MRKDESLLVLVEGLDPDPEWVNEELLETAGLQRLPPDWDWDEWLDVAKEKLEALVLARFKGRYSFVRVVVLDEQYWSSYVTGQGHAYDKIKQGLGACEAVRGAGWQFDIYADAADAGTAAVLESRCSTDA